MEYSSGNEAWRVESGDPSITRAALKCNGALDKSLWLHRDTSRMGPTLAKCTKMMGIFPFSRTGAASRHHSIVEIL
jgi:hypothetical protein